MTARLPLTGPLDLAATLDSGQAFRWRPQVPTSSGQGGGWWRGVLGSNAVRLRVPTRRDGERLYLEVESSPEPEDDLLPHLVRYLDLERDIDGVHHALAMHPYLQRAIASFSGLRILRQEPWECTVSFLLSPQSNIPRIRRNVEALAQAAGEPIETRDSPVYGFPSPEALADLGEARLRQLGLGFRAKAVAAVASKVATGELDLAALQSLPFSESEAALQALPGVGPKVAHCILAFSLDKGEGFPVDRWVRRGVLREFFQGRKTNDKVITAWARETFGPLSGYAQQLIFHWERSQALEERPLPGSRAFQGRTGPARAQSVERSSSKTRSITRLMMEMAWP
ncbi:MAG: DNA-3-methyladenine glycosylase 2 family protein [Chloroflexi bacterium]|nr:DNA-3-methyladenine glycosylase 2 family protein [Chloroflexota bacterium]